MEVTKTVPMKKLLMYFMFTSVLLSGCAVRQQMIEDQSEMMRVWKGSHISKVIRSWGEPHEIVPDGKGGNIYIWQPSIYTLSSDLDVEYKRIRMFYVNPSGIVYSWKWRGL